MFRIIASNSSNISAACEQAFRRDLAARHLRRGQPKDPGAQLAERENAVGIDAPFSTSAKSRDVAMYRMNVIESAPDGYLHPAGKESNATSPWLSYPAMAA